MGNSSSTTLGSRSTAKQVVEHFGTGNYLAGKTAIVTGGNSGIGLETCKALAFAGCRVILCTRSVKAGEEAVNTEIKKSGHGGYVVDASNIVVKALDLASLPSIKAFADDFLATEQRLDFLVLNAGIMALPKLEYTEAGFEKQIGVNHFGHFYLHRLLHEKMLNAPDTAGRVVILSSTAHSMGHVRPNDLHYRKGRTYNGWPAYGQSKQANILHAKSIADLTKGTHITAVSVHPGVIATNLWRQSWSNRFISVFIPDKSIPQGAATTLYGCLCPTLVEEGQRGAYLVDCAIANPIASANSVALREEFYKVCTEELDAALKPKEAAAAPAAAAADPQC